MDQLNYSAWSAQQAQKQMDFQERMSNTAHQREVEDLKAAGLNPVLSSGGNGASTPSGAAATGNPDDFSSAAGAIQAFAYGFGRGTQDSKSVFSSDAKSALTKILAGLTSNRSSDRVAAFDAALSLGALTGNYIADNLDSWKNSAHTFITRYQERTASAGPNDDGIGMNSALHPPKKSIWSRIVENVKSNRGLGWN